MQSDDENISLDLNEEWRIFIRTRLRTFGAEYPNSKFNINCWVDDNVTITAQEINAYLAENECPSILKKGGEIIGKGRTTFYNLSKKEIP